MDCTCLTCFNKLDDETDLEGNQAKPRPGDFAVCIYCGTVTMYTESGMAEITNRDMAMIALTQPEVYKELQIARNVILSRIKQN